ncbi:MAG: ABC transporter substrate-binding protein [Lachnospiraceae bacterium]|nr:ABC transporter substrate-binding protein [Lachnospiraceae bacterium]
MKKTTVCLLSCFMALFLTACAVPTDPAGAAKATGNPTDSGEAESEDKEGGSLPEYTVILDYIPNTNHTGMYVAADKGYYEEEGFKVSFIEPTDLDSNTVVATGGATFGVTYQEDLTLARAASDPLPVKAIAALIQHNTSGFVSLKGSGYTDPENWEGLTYAGWGGAGEEAVLNAVMIGKGKDPEKLNRIIADGLGYETLGKACDLMWFFEAWDCIQAEMGGVELDYVPCRELDERLDYYTPILAASEDTMENDPELIRAFLRATEKGYEFAIENPDEAAEILHKYVPDYDPSLLKRSQEYLADKFTEDSKRWGEMKDETWRNYTDFLLEYGVLEADVDPADCFTNEFLP